MAYIFHQDDLPRLLSKGPGRERIFFASKELSGMDDMLAGVTVATFTSSSTVRNLAAMLRARVTILLPAGVEAVSDRMVGSDSRFCASRIG